MQSLSFELFEQDGWFIAYCRQPEITTQAGSLGEAQENAEEAAALKLGLGAGEVAAELSGIVTPSAPTATGTQAMSFRQLRFHLVAQGFTEISQSSNHAMFSRQEPGGSLSAILPHYTTLTPFVVDSVLRQAQLTLPR